MGAATWLLQRWSLDTSAVFCCVMLSSREYGLGFLHARIYVHMRMPTRGRTCAQILRTQTEQYSSILQARPGSNLNGDGLNASSDGKSGADVPVHYTHDLQGLLLRLQVFVSQ